jgi:dolichol-phosphate mannosyltransferase
MSNSRPASSSLSDIEQTAVRYYPVSNGYGTSVQRKLEPGEAFVVPSFEVAESLIAYGADSARIAISQIDSSDVNYPGYAQIAVNQALVPIVPFRFERSILIVLPTYNERQNLEAMVETIGRYLVADILIVDDNSPDGTGQLADQLSRQQKHVHVLHRAKKEGLGPAYLAGFRWALAHSYQLIIEMDCDFSHSPWDLPRLVHRSKAADLVIGSRYIPGGGTQNWSRRRRLVSRFGNTYVSLFLGSSIRDWTGGFRCYRHELLANMNLETVIAKGYVFQVEMAWRACQLKVEICELPIRFSDRVQGQSKLGWQSIVEAITEVPRMYFQTTPSR